MVSTIFLRNRSNEKRAMPTRRSHNKSRKGCLVCKRRRVKCDEQYPTCGACETRGTECEYASTSAAQPMQRSKSPPEERPASSDPFPGQPWVTAERLDVDELNWPEFLEPDCKLQLELMYQWTTSTYRSFCRSTPSDQEACRVDVPKLALQHDYLLHALLAAASFDLAILEDGPRRQLYTKAGLGRKQLALRGFRKTLPNLNRENHEALLHCSAVLMVLSLASLQLCPPSAEDSCTVEKILDHVQLTRGITIVYEANPEGLQKSALLQDYLPFEKLPEAPIDPKVSQGIDMLSQWNAVRPAETGSFDHRRRIMARKTACDKGIFWLREFWSKCSSRDAQGYVLGWPEVAGDEYLDAVREHDHVALAILAFWGVMVEQAATEVWWARRVGALLFEETSEKLTVETNHTGAGDVMAEIGRQLRMVQDRHANQPDTCDATLSGRMSDTNDQLPHSMHPSICVPRSTGFRHDIMLGGLSTISKRIFNTSNAMDIAQIME